MRQDSANHVYQVWGQEQPASCAIASIWMARSQAKQQSFAEEEWELAWRIYQRVINGISPLLVPDSPPPPPVCINANAVGNDQSTFYNTFGNAGTFATQVVQALRSDGLKATHEPRSGFPHTVKSVKLSQTTPAIVLLGWYSNSGGTWSRNGGHFIVAADVVGNQIVFLDPWDAQLRELPNDGHYQASGWIEEVVYVSA
jgi:hypothetical protein